MATAMVDEYSAWPERTGPSPQEWESEEHAFAEEVTISFYFLSGEFNRCAVARSITSCQLFELAAALVGRRSVSLWLGTTRLMWDLSQPLLRMPKAPRGEPAPVVPITVVIEQVSALKDDAPKLMDLVRARRWMTALQLLRAHGNPSSLARQRDGEGDTILSWAAYRATQGHGAAEVIRELLRWAPEHARLRNQRNHFLPLHEAAWGHAPAEVAVLLLAAHPAALEVRIGGETPYEVGRYYHGRLFRWPRPEELLRYALAVRAQGQLQAAICRLRRPGQKRAERPLPEAVATGLRLPPLVGLIIARFLASASAAPRMAAAPPPPRTAAVEAEAMDALAAEQSQPGEVMVLTERSSGPEGIVQALFDGLLCGPQPRAPRARPTNGGRRCRTGPLLKGDGLCRRKRPPRGRCPRAESPGGAACQPSAVEHLREPAIKARGRLAGAAQVRHHRCSFTEISEVAIGGFVHKLQTHSVRTVRKDLQRQPEESRWPSKAPLLRERARARTEKQWEAALPGEMVVEVAECEDQSGLRAGCTLLG